jgi:hypothetical protein
LLGANPIEVKKGIYDYDKLVDLAQKGGWTFDLVDGEMWSEAYGKNLPLVFVTGENKMWLQRVIGVSPDSEAFDGSIEAINVAQEADEGEAPDDFLLEINEYEEAEVVHEQHIAALTAQLDDESLTYEDWAKIKVQIAIKTWEAETIYKLPFFSYIWNLTLSIMQSLGLNTEDGEDNWISAEACTKILEEIEYSVAMMIAEMLSQVEIEGEEETINLHKYLKEKFESK